MAVQPETVIGTESEDVTDVTEEPKTEEKTGKMIAASAETTEEPETGDAIADVTEETESETEESETGEIVVTDMSATKYAKSNVNVRKGPGTEYDKVGYLTTNQQVAVTGQADTGWFRIEMNGEVAYVSNKFLSDEKVTVNKAKNNTSAGTAAADNNVANGTAGNSAGEQQQQIPPENSSTGTDNAGNNGAGEQQPQIPPTENNNNTSSGWTQEELENYYGESGIFGGATLTDEEIQESLNNVPDDVTNIVVNPDGTITGTLH